MQGFGSLTLAQTDPAPPPPPGANGPAPAGGPAPAEGTTAQPGGAQVNDPGAIGNPWSMPIMIALVFAVMWVLIIMPQRREKKKHAMMLSQLKKGDRVQTIGGILGTVIEVRDREVVVKVDESSNTRVKFIRSAIQGIIAEEGKETAAKVTEKS